VWLDHWQGGERQRIGGRETSGGGVSPGHSWARQNSRVAPTTRCRQKRYAYVPEVTVHISVTWFSFSPWDSDRSQVAERLRADMQAFAAAALSFAGVRAYLGRLGAATRSAHAIMTRIPRSCPVGGIRCRRIYSSRGAGLSEVSARLVHSAITLLRTVTCFRELTGRLPHGCPQRESLT
jgi:hypothetical protein